MRRLVFVDGLDRQAGAVVPGALDEVEVGAQADAGAAQGRAQRVGQRQAQHLPVHGQHLAGLQVAGDPIDVLGGGARAHLLERDAAASQLGLGLGPVAAVGEQRGLLASDDQAADRAGEARQPFAALPALRQVFGQVGVAGGYERGVHALGGQGVAQALDAQAGFGGAGVHGQDLFRVEATSLVFPRIGFRPGPARALAGAPAIRARCGSGCRRAGRRNRGRTGPS